MSAIKAAIPYEMQSDPQTNRTCGAACLSMVYRSFGKEVSQAEIWPAIAKENRFGTIASTTHLMAKDALTRGFAAVAFQARDPLQALRLCCQSGMRAILNHRSTNDSPTGHYTVLVDLDERDVVLHDPFYGPSRRVPHAELLELWQPHFPNSEIAGYLLIGIGTETSTATSCWLCRASIPPTVPCPKCQGPVSLQPSVLLGCVSSDCVARMWNFICCPFCDSGFTLTAQGAPGNRIQSGPPLPASPAAQPTEPLQKDPLNLGRVFAEIDKFSSFVLTIPGAANHPQIKKRLDFLASSKERLRLLQAEALVHRKVHQDQLAKFVQTAKQNEEAHRKKMEELNRPAPPLDGNALGHALLKNLGLRD